MCGRGRAAYCANEVQRVTRARAATRRNASKRQRTQQQSQRQPQRQHPTAASSSTRLATARAESHDAVSDNSEMICGSPRKEEDSSVGDMIDVMTFQPIENVSPGMALPIVYTSREDGGREMDLMVWGLIPHFHHSTVSSSDHYKMFIARIESICEKVSFKGLVNRNRCVVMMSGFYEWKGKVGDKTPYYITLKDEEPMLMAGLYEESAEGLLTFTILTCDSCKDFAVVHDRQPVTLTPALMDKWLDPKADVHELIGLLRDSEGLGLQYEFHEVSKRMTNAAYQGGDCSKPVVKADMSSFFGKKPVSSSKASKQPDSHISCPVCDTDITGMKVGERENHVIGCLETPHSAGQKRSRDVT